MEGEFPLHRSGLLAPRRVLGMSGTIQTFRGLAIFPMASRVLPATRFAISSVAWLPGFRAHDLLEVVVTHPGRLRAISFRRPSGGRRKLYGSKEGLVDRGGESIQLHLRIRIYLDNTRNAFELIRQIRGAGHLHDQFGVAEGNRRIVAIELCIAGVKRFFQFIGIGWFLNRNQPSHIPPFGREIKAPAVSGVGRFCPRRP